jgi:hypothetical protein
MQRLLEARLVTLSKKKIPLLVCLLIAAMASGVGGESAISRESQVKAAMLCNFVQFVDWPPGTFEASNSPLVIAVMNPNPFADVLDELVRGKTVSGRSIVIRHCNSAEELHGCQELFVPAARSDDLEALLHAVAQKPVLSVGETDSFPEAGGVLRFYVEGNKVRFEVNPGAVTDAHLQISSKLLKLATIFRR